jgi:thiol:disulfide interchange protein DsbD
MPSVFRIATRLLALLGRGVPWSMLAAVASMPAVADDFLPVRDAYKVTATAEPGSLAIRFTVANGYYLYRDKLGFSTADPGVQVGAPSLPVGLDHEDEFFGRQVIYRGPTVVGLPVSFSDGAPRDFTLQVRLQGCADGGLCYPPQKWDVPVKWPAGLAAEEPATAQAAARASGTAPTTTGADAAPVEPAARPGGFSLRSLIGSGPETDGEFLHVDRAFVMMAESPSRDRIRLRWDIADGYYLYRDKTKVTTDAPGVQLGAPVIPGGKVQHDEYFGEQVVLHGEMVADVAVSAAADVTEVPITVSYQGCADAGLCYPPQKKTLTVRLAAMAPAGAVGDGAASSGAFRSEQDALADRIRDGNLLAVLAAFFGFGLLLAFTPCVLPMVPILSGIIVGAGRGQPVSRGRAFSLSLAYVLGMALTYTVAGAAFAAAGQQAQAFFQKPWMIVLFAALFVWLALGMFGLFNLQVPAWLQARINTMSDQQKQGTLLGTAVMGALSSLIVTACVAPPLVASLAVIGQTGDVFRGGAALFALSLGMGAPLLLVGASAGALLPRAGAWMESVKQLFGLMLLGVAIWMLGRILPGPVTLALWAALAFVGGYAMGFGAGATGGGGLHAVRRGVGALAMLYGALLLVGALAGRSDPLQPLAGLQGIAGAVGGAAQVDAGHGAEHFKRIKSVADLEREVAAATASGRSVLLDFYADWCVACKEMEKYTFPDPAVQQALASTVMLQADVTANDDTDQALMQHLGILGPPSILFFGSDGLERPEFRVVGFKRAEEFASHVSRAVGAAP